MIHDGEKPAEEPHPWEPVSAPAPEWNHQEQLAHLDRVRRRPGRYGLDGSFGSYVTYLQGFDDGARGALLRCFREWLIPRIGEGNNLTWPALVVRHALPKEEAIAFYRSPGPDRHKAVINSLFGCLTEFLDHRDGAPDGLRRIHREYVNWLDRQPWSRLTAPKDERF